MACLILGYDDDGTIDETILGFIRRIAHTERLNYSNYLFDAIYSQLVQVTSLMCFGYQSSLIDLVL
jgi:hypothetical protein